MVHPDDKKLLELCLSRKLVNKVVATEAYHRARKEERSVAVVLVDMGALARHVVEALRRELDLVLAPDAIKGFRIIRKIGQGGMGSVYLAEQLSLQREVALKIIAPQFSADAHAVDRFMREARTAALVNHPNVISVIDVGFNGGHLYMALELVSGGDAAQLAARSHGVLPEIRALEIISDCCRGLEALHEAHLLHRDIKPANIFITRHGIAKLADLGLARSEQGDDCLTVFGHAVGTPAFMSPEQASGKEHVDTRSDIYSLGASLFSLTTGSQPFTGNGPYALVAKLLTEPAPDPRSLNPNLSVATSRIITRCLAKRATDRFQTPQELYVAVAEVLASGHQSGTSSFRATTSAIRPTTERTTRSLHTPPTFKVHKTRPVVSKRNRRVVPWPLIGGVAALIAILVVIGMTGMPRQAPSPGPTSQESTPTPPTSVTPVEKSPVVAAPAPVRSPVRPAVPSSKSVMSVMPGLIAYWPLDEGVGVQAGDFSGNGSTGTITGGTWGPGKIGGAVNFSSPSKIVCSGIESPTPVEAITVMCWIKTRQSGTEHEPVSVLRHDGRFTALQLAQDGTARAVTWGAGHMNITTFPWRGVWDDDRWHHYAVTYHQDEGVKIYRDGQIQAQGKGIRGALPARTPAPFVLGASELDGEYFIGSLDDVRVYQRQLSAAEMGEIATATAP